MALRAKVKVLGDFKKTLNHLHFLGKQEYLSDLDRYGIEGVNALSDATPVRTGKTAASWQYRIEKSKKGTKIVWYNTNKANNGVSIVILIQYGHGTKSGYFIQGRDFINPAIQPVFDDIGENVWKAVVDNEHY